jgi:hypothetical protein
MGMLARPVIRIDKGRSAPEKKPKPRNEAKRSAPFPITEVMRKL